MKVTIIDNTPQIGEMLKQKASIFLRVTADAIVNLSTPNTPKKTGRLRMDIVKSVLGLNGKVVWGKNYAAKMEEVQFKNYTTSGTGPDFAKNAVNEVAGKTSGIAKVSGLI